MTKVRRPYSRVYWEVIDDPKFAHVWDDDRALATWLRLLVAADMAWPASATLPRSSHAKSVAVLVDAGLVDRQAGDRYRIHGLDKERNARSEQAAGAANARHNGMHPDEPPHPASTADGMRPHPVSTAQRVPSQDEQRKDETRRDEPSNGARDPMGSTGELDEAFLSWMQRTHQVTVRPGNGWHLRIIDWFRQGTSFDDAKDAVTAAVEAGARLDRQVIPAAEDILFPRRSPRSETPAERKERERQEYLDRTRAEVAAAKVAQA